MGRSLAVAICGALLASVSCGDSSSPSLKGLPSFDGAARIEITTENPAASGVVVGHCRIFANSVTVNGQDERLGARVTVVMSGRPPRLRSGASGIGNVQIWVGTTQYALPVEATLERVTADGRNGVVAVPAAFDTVTKEGHDLGARVSWTCDT